MYFSFYKSVLFIFSIIPFWGLFFLLYDMFVDLFKAVRHVYRICGGNQFARGDCVIRFTADGGLGGPYFHLWRRAVVYYDFHAVEDDVEAGGEAVAEHDGREAALRERQLLCLAFPFRALAHQGAALKTQHAHRNKGKP